MNKSFYPRLAVSNLRKNRQIYLPYMIACTATIIMYFIMRSLASNTHLKEIKGGAQMFSILGFGTFVIAIFSLILLFYTNSFLMKQRKKEIGLYNILGMEKRHIAIMMGFETIITYIICMTLGLILGTILNKLMFLLLLKLLHFDVTIQFMIPLSAVRNTITLFGVIFFITFLFNLFQIHLAKPVELLAGNKMGEKEPKGRILFTILGLFTLFGGYIIANVTDNPIQAIGVFFIAILLVIIGTYLLFTTGSITLLKILKKNKNYYYRTDHFISTSSMIYRMKQNAVGLASICILSTAVLLTLSTTVSMYWGMRDILKARFPQQVSVTLYNPTDDSIKSMQDTLSEKYDAYHVSPDNILSFSSADLYAFPNDDTFHIYSESERELKTKDYEKVCYISMIPLSDYNNLTNNKISLDSNEALIYQVGHEFDKKEVHINDDTYHIAGSCSDLPIIDASYASYYDTYYMVLPDTQRILSYSNLESNNNYSAIDYCYRLDLNGTDENVYNCSTDIFNTLFPIETLHVECRDEARNDFFALYGSLFFIGIFLGALFLGATVLIIYYKQISEGYDDRERYIIMEKVGLSKREIKKSIHSQILKVFFLPILMAVIHIAFAFRLMKNLLALLSLTNIMLFFTCTIGTIVIFAIIYSIVYIRTARTYYKIVN